MSEDFNELAWIRSLGEVKAENDKNITHTLVAIPLTLEVEVPLEVYKDEDYLRNLAEEILDPENGHKVDNYFNITFDVNKKIRYKFYDKNTKGV